MTTNDEASDNLSLTEIAFELFKVRSYQSGILPQQLAIACFRDATAFIAASEQVLAGEVDLFEDDTNPLDEAFAPNLKKTHPINLMSRAWGDLTKVEQVLAELEANPAAETYEPYSWNQPEVNQARALFPAVVARAKHLSMN